MKKYRNKNKSKKERSERIGFVTAFTVCIIAIGLAIGSTYASIGGLEGNLSGGGSGYTASSGKGTEAVDNEVEGIMIGAEETSTSETAMPTTASEVITDPEPET